MCVVYEGELSPYYDIAYLYAEVIQKCVCMPICTLTELYRGCVTDHV